MRRSLISAGAFTFSVVRLRPADAGKRFLRQTRDVRAQAGLQGPGPHVPWLLGGGRARGLGFWSGAGGLGGTKNLPPQGPAQPGRPLLCTAAATEMIGPRTRTLPPGDKRGCAPAPTAASHDTCGATCRMVFPAHVHRASRIAHRRPSPSTTTPQTACKRDRVGASGNGNALLHARRMCAGPRLAHASARGHVSDRMRGRPS